MHIALWVIAVLLAAAFVYPGTTKLRYDREQLVEAGLGWYRGWPPVAIKVLGVLELLAAVGLVLPAVIDIAPILVPIAATGLAVTMAGAMAVHARRGEFRYLALNLALLILAAAVAWGRFGPYAF